MSKYYVVKKLLIVFTACVLISCGGLNNQESLQKAREYLDKGDYRAAIISVKSILGANPRSTESRLLLSEIYLRIGDGKSAEKEIRQYIKYGGDEKSVRVNFGLALLLQYDSKRLLNEIHPAGLNDKDQSAIYAMQGDALLMSGRSEKALEAYNKSLSLDKRNQRAMLGQALYYIGIRERGKAKAALNTVIAVYPEYGKAYYIKGQLDELDGNPENALKSYEKAVRLFGKHIYGDEAFVTRIAYINLLLRMGKFDQSKKHLAEVVKVQAKHPLTLYTQAITFFREKQLDFAEQKLYQVLKVSPDDMASHLLLGTILYQKGLYEQANNYVTRYVANIPTNIQARKLLAAIRIKLQKQDEAIEVLKQTQPDQRDAEIVAMIGKLAIEAGKPHLATSTLKSEIAKHPGDLRIREILARSLMEQGEYQEAIRTIREYSGPEQEKASLLVLEALLRKGDHEQATKLVNNLLKQNPASRSFITAAGYVALDLGDRNEARKYFEKASGNNSDFIPAILYLARMDIEDGRLDDAQKHYDRVLLIKQNNSQALMGLAQIEERRGNPEFALKWLIRAYESNKDELTPAIILANYYLENNAHKSAITLLTNLALRHPGNIKVMLLQARAYVLNHHDNSAEKIYLNIISRYPRVTSAYVDLGALYARNNQSKKARDILAKAVVSDPNSLHAKGMLGITEMRSGNYDLALKIAHQIQKDNNASAVGFVLAGDIYLFTSKFDDAISSYQEAVKRTTSNRIVYKIFHAYQRKGDTEGAIQALSEWSRKHPSDLKVELDLANAYLWTNKQAKAEHVYKNILLKNPTHIGSLNNLAEIYLSTSPKLALSYAERAHKLVPNSPAIMDTLGWAHYKNGNLEKALDLVSKAAASMDNPVVHYHHAVLLAKSGKVKQSIRILKTLIQSKKAFTELNDAKVLLKTLEK